MTDMHIALFFKLVFRWDVQLFKRKPSGALFADTNLVIEQCVFLLLTLFPVLGLQRWNQTGTASGINIFKWRLRKCRSSSSSWKTIYSSKRSPSSCFDQVSGIAFEHILSFSLYTEYTLQSTAVKFMDSQNMIKR